MLRILTVLCLVGASLAGMGGGGGEAMIKKYAYMKIMSSCIGEETVMKYKMEMKAACDKCEGQDIMQTIIDIQAMIKELKRQNSPFTRKTVQTPTIVQVPYFIPQQQFQQYPVYPQPQMAAIRQKRHIDLSPEGIEKMKAKMMSKISNMTCVLKEINAIDADNQPNYEYFNEEVNNLPVDEALKEDFREAMDMCRDFAMCMPVEKMKNPIKKELGTAVAFMKCMHMKKVKVCMANDLKKYAGMMGYEGDVNSEESGDLMQEITSMLTEGFEFM